jgi:hypothetical protein
MATKYASYFQNNLSLWDRWDKVLEVTLWQSNTLTHIVEACVMLSQSKALKWSNYAYILRCNALGIVIYLWKVFAKLPRELWVSYNQILQFLVAKFIVVLIFLSAENLIATLLQLYFSLILFIYFFEMCKSLALIQNLISRLTQYIIRLKVHLMFIIFIGCLELNKPVWEELLCCFERDCGVFQCGSPYEYAVNNAEILH